MRLHLERDFYIPKDSVPVQDPNSTAIAYCYQREGGKPGAVMFTAKIAKPAWHYTFKSEEQRDQYIAAYFRQTQEREQGKVRRKELKKKAAAEFVNPYKVGDLLHSSWGYEQTNVEFFQVLKVGPRSLQIRQIGCESRDTGFMSGQARPVKDKFLEKSEPVWVTIQVKVGYNGEPYHSVPSPIHGNLYPTSEKEEHYWSSYA